MDEIYDVVIVGGGLSGLYFLYKLLQIRPDWKILLLEKENRLGGRIWTVYDDQENPLYEKGARRVSLEHSLMIKLLDELDIEYSLIESMYTAGENISNFPHEIKGNFLYIHNGFNTIINNLAKKIPTQNICLNTKVNNILHTDNFLIEINNNESLVSKIVVLACPPYFFKEWNVVKNINEILELIDFYSINRILGYCKNISYQNYNNFQLFVDNDLKKIESSIYNNNWFTISYTCQNVANYWEQLYCQNNQKYNNDLLKLINEIFEKKLDIQKCENVYWKCGNHLWKSDCAKQNYNEILNPIYNLYIVGEAYSLNQGWCEGALETVNDCLCKMFNFHNVKINYTNDIELFYNQENTNSCSSNALSSILSFILQRQGLYSYPISRLFIYYNTRFLMNQTKKDQGSDPIIAIDAIKKFGVCPENMWPLTKDNVFLKPPECCYEFANNFPVDINYSTFLISQQNDWVKTCSKYLCNGILLYCGMKRFNDQDINAEGFVNSVPQNQKNIWFHAIVMIGIDEDLKYATFLNSHEFESAIFKMSFEQIENLNPIQDTIYVINATFINNKYFNLNKFQAVLEFNKHSLENYFASRDNLKYESIIFNKVFDHIIIGAGITGRYLAYKLCKHFPNESILVITNELENSESAKTSVNVSNVLDSLIPYTALSYFDYPFMPIPGLIKEFNISEPENEINTITFNEQFYNSKFIKVLENILQKSLNISLSNDNFLNCLKDLFEDENISKIYGDAFLRLEGLNRDEINYIYSQLRRSFPALAIYYFIVKVFSSTLTQRRSLNTIIKPLLQNFVKHYTFKNLGDFVYDYEQNNIFLWDMNMSQINIDSMNIVIRKQTLSNKPLSSALKIFCKNVYVCNLTCERDTSKLQPVSNYNINLYLFIKYPINEFIPFRHDSWGLVSYINKNTINCKDVSIDFFNTIQISFELEIKSNVLYDIEISSEISKIINDSKPLKNIDITHWMVFLYPYSIKFQQVTNDNSFLTQLDYQLNIYGFDHYLNSGYSLLPLNIEGSILMVDHLIDLLPTVGILYDSNFETINSDSLREINEIVGVKKVYINYNELDKLDNFLNSIQMLIVAGSDNNNIKDHYEFVNKLINQIKYINENNHYLPAIFICYGFEILINHEFPNLSFILSFSKEAILNLIPYNQGILSSLETKNTYHDHNFGIIANYKDFEQSPYKIINIFKNFNNQTFIGTIEHKFLPIFGVQWHPFDSKTENYIKNIQFLKSLIKN